jgi:cellulose synthase/poly-beta-1,6-N-acetylglucosamine synthase-like glycosyltransferase
MLANLLFWSSACYVGLAHGGALLLNLAAWSGLRRAEQGNMLAELPHVHTDLEPPISVILQAHDDASRVVPALRALLTLHYPALEIIVVNDGSKDNTMEVLRTAFELLPFPEAYRVQLATRAVTFSLRCARSCLARLAGRRSTPCSSRRPVCN